jgi:hypothetical protein
MEDVFSFVGKMFQERFFETETIIFFIGIGGLLVFALFHELSNARDARRAHRARRKREDENSTAIFPKFTLPGSGDEQRDLERELDKWREEHKTQLD